MFDNVTLVLLYLVYSKKPTLIITSPNGIKCTAISLLYAPLSGENTRDLAENIKENITDLIDEIKETTDKIIEEGKELTKEKKVELLAAIEAGKKPWRKREKR